MVAGVTYGKGRVPSALPPILKNYTKAAIRTQPGDLIAWSYAYFHSLMEGESPPVKEQIEYPLPNTETGVTPGLMRVLHKKLSNLKMVPKKKYNDLCQTMGIKESAASKAWESTGDGSKAPWDHLLVSLVAEEVESPKDQVSFIMTIISDDPITKRVPLETTLKYLDMVLENNGETDSKLQEDTKDYLADVASYQDDYLIPSDLSRETCPLK